MTHSPGRCLGSCLRDSKADAAPAIGYNKNVRRELLQPSALQAKSAHALTTWGSFKPEHAAQRCLEEVSGAGWIKRDGLYGRGLDTAAPFPTVSCPHIRIRWRFYR